MRNDHVLIPISLNLFRVEKPLTVHGPMADFSRLPFFDGEFEVNSDTAFLSEDIVCPAFLGDATLEPGVHLHWQLPEALTRSFDNVRWSDGDKGAQFKDDVRFPSVPNMWLITRELTTPNNQVSTTRWIVESDYLYPPGEGFGTNAICYPIGYRAPQKDANGNVKHEPPFRNMGRVLHEEQWTLLDQPYQTLADVSGYSLTSLGYGEPAFAAFYPNCRSVFGFCDHDPGKPGDNAVYSVTGWYRDANEDLLQSGVLDQDFSNRIGVAPDKIADAASYNAWRRHGFFNTFGWKLEDHDVSVPQRSLYVARKSAAAPKDQQDSVNLLDVSIAAGNSGTEALSCHLGNLMGAGQAHTEDRLEALHLMGELDHLRIDTGAKFEEARHARGFQGVPGGTLWRIVRSEVGKNEQSSQISLPYLLSHPLAQLNDSQYELDAARFQHESRQTQAFSDWYKYMLCAYPPADEQASFPDADEALFLMRREYLTDWEDRATALATLKQAVDAAIAGIKTVLTSKDMTPDLKGLTLKPSAAPRFWMPNDPVLLFAGHELYDETAPSRNNLQVVACKSDKRLCLTNEIHQEIQGALDKQEEAAAKIDNENGAVALNDPSRRPIMMEWEVEVWPHANNTTYAKKTDGMYNSDFLTSQYDLPGQETDLVGLDRAALREIDPSIYQGRCILSHHSKPVLIAQMDAFIEGKLVPVMRESDDPQPDVSDETELLKWWDKHLGADFKMLRYFQEHSTPVKQRTDEFKSSHASEIDTWYENSGYEATDTYIGEILRIKAQISNGFHAMSQTLTGFNSALAGRRQTLQMAIKDPLAFRDGPHKRSDYRSFATAMGKFIDGKNRLAPQPMWGFNPMRSGHLRLSRIVLIDSYGRRSPIEKAKIEAADVSRTLRGQQAPSTNGEFVLPPRFSQPVRLNMRWLSNGEGAPKDHDAYHEDVEANIHPASSPICGWIVPNNLNNSLAVFDERGAALGYLDLDGEWRAPPGHHALDPDATIKEAEKLEHPPSGLIINPHLRRVVQWIEQKRNGDQVENAGVMTGFQSAIDKALEGVDPANWAQHEDLVLLMGRPIAVVRVMLDFQLQGSPNLDPGWGTFRKALAQGRNHAAESGFVEDVDVSVRLGEHHQLNDGMLGFWKEWDANPNTGDLPTDFYSPQAESLQSSTAAGNKRIHCTPPQGEENPFTIKLSLGGHRRVVTMLVDPRGTLHATSGVVPTKNIRIPVDQYADVLSKIEMSFLTAPVLSPIRNLASGVDPIEMPSPKEAGYVSNWLQADGKDWHKVSKIQPPHAEAQLSTKTSIREGWMQLRPAPKVPENGKLSDLDGQG